MPVLELVEMTGTQERFQELERPLHPAEPARRRSPRLVCRIPLTLSLASHFLPVVSAVINAQGALLLCPETISEGTPIALFNEKTGRRVEASVVWTDSVDMSLLSPSLFRTKIGVAFRRRDVEFWGSDFEA